MDPTFPLRDNFANRKATGVETKVEVSNVRTRRVRLRIKSFRYWRDLVILRTKFKLKIDADDPKIDPIKYLDILWVIDNSCSMTEEQQALSQNFASFVQYFVGSGLDYHIGVVSTDWDNLAGDHHDAGRYECLARDPRLRVLREDRVEDALSYCNDQQGPVPAVLSAGIRKYLMLQQLGHDPARIEEQVVKAMDDYGVHIVAALERHLPVLGTVSSAAPMLGFLGTVAGMITSFQDIVDQMGETNIVESASQGISQALLTTCFGLIVGIPAFMAFNYFTSVINGFVLEVEGTAAELIETLSAPACNI